MKLQEVKRRPILSSEFLALRALDDMNAELRARNEVRLAEAKIALGTKYLLHPANSPQRTEYRNVLDKRESHTNDLHTKE